jgi:hypothetical protein
VGWVQDGRVAPGPSPRAYHAREYMELRRPSAYQLIVKVPTVMGDRETRVAPEGACVSAPLRCWEAYEALALRVRTSGTEQIPTLSLASPAPYPSCPILVLRSPLAEAVVSPFIVRVCGSGLYNSGLAGDGMARPVDMWPFVLFLRLQEDRWADPPPSGARLAGAYCMPRQQ